MSVKIDSNILDSGIMLSDSDTLKVWIIILVSCNRDGVADLPISKFLMRGIPTDKIDEILEKFMQPDKASRSLDNGGVRLEHVDGDKYLVLDYKKYNKPGAKKTVEKKQVKKEYRYLAELLHSKIKQAGTDKIFKESDIHTWADEFRKMVELDRRPIDVVKSKIDDVFNDDFWKTVIRSTSKFRKQWNDGKFDRLRKKSDNEEVLPPSFAFQNPEHSERTLKDEAYHYFSSCRDIQKCIPEGIPVNSVIFKEVCKLRYMHKLSGMTRFQSYVEVIRFFCKKLGKEIPDQVLAA